MGMLLLCKFRQDESEGKLMKLFTSHCAYLDLNDNKVKIA